ncbi:MAG TPA: ubiquitin-like small modifier protein 1 [Methanocella sp.]|nr:ubiquitin-like small modifier protein 1 [Methanocella sp.]
MTIKFKLFANFREATKQKDVEVSPADDTAGAAIRGLVSKYPSLEPLLYQDGKLKPYVNVLLNGESLKGEGRIKAKVKDGDEIALFPPVSGG